MCERVSSATRERTDRDPATPLSWAQGRFLLEACAFLVLARASVRFLPFRWTMRLFGLRPAASPAEQPPVMLPPAAGLAVWAVRAAAARLPWVGNCLARALAGSAMLSRRGVATSVQLGAALGAGADGGMAAHAWLRHGGATLTGGGPGGLILVATFDVGGRPCSGGAGEGGRLEDEGTGFPLRRCDVEAPKERGGVWPSVGGRGSPRTAVTIERDAAICHGDRHQLPLNWTAARYYPDAILPGLGPLQSTFDVPSATTRKAGP